MNKIITKYVIRRGKQISVDELKDSSNIKIVVECKHGQREVRWCRKDQLCRKCAAEAGIYNTSSKGRDITWGKKISKAKKGKEFSEEHKKALIESRKKKICKIKGIKEERFDGFPTSDKYKPRKFIMLCGQSGVGKTTLLNGFADKFNIVSYDSMAAKQLDSFIANNYFKEKTIIVDIPIKISTLYKKYCEKYDIHMVFLIEDPEVVKTRLASRGGNIGSVDSRHKRMLKLCENYGDFAGSYDEVYEYLSSLKF